jgi:hypothetical protein
VKFQVRKINRSIDKNEKGVGNEIFKFKKISKKIDKNEQGIENENFTTTIAAQGDTGANCSATDTIDIIHNYKKFARKKIDKIEQGIENENFTTTIP